MHGDAWWRARRPTSLGGLGIRSLTTQAGIAHTVTKRKTDNQTCRIGVGFACGRATESDGNTAHELLEKDETGQRRSSPTGVGSTWTDTGA